MEFIEYRVKPNLELFKSKKQISNSMGLDLQFKRCGFDYHEIIFNGKSIISLDKNDIYLDSNFVGRYFDVSESIFIRSFFYNFQMKNKKFELTYLGDRFLEGDWNLLEKNEVICKFNCKWSPFNIGYFLRSTFDSTEDIMAIYVSFLILWKNTYDYDTDAG